MTTYFITRHSGALAWAKAKGVEYDMHLEHLQDFDTLKKGDVVIGTLPINIVAKINEMGVRYVHLSLSIPQDLRGVELTDDELNACQASLEEFWVSKAQPKYLYKQIG